MATRFLWTLLFLPACTTGGSAPRRVDAADDSADERPGDASPTDSAEDSGPRGRDTDGKDTDAPDTDAPDTDKIDTHTGNVDTADTDVQVELAWNEAAFTADWRDAISCGTAGKISFELEATGAGVAAVYIVETRPGQTYPWAEYHTLPQTGFGTDWGLFYRSLTTRATLVTQTPDVSTLYRCGTGGASLDPTALSTDFVSAVYVGLWSPSEASALADSDPTDDPVSPSDCIAFGYDVPFGYTVTGIAGASTRPAWVKPANCRTLAPTAP